jgi:cytochrome c-type biogenesis protein CcmH
MIWVALLTLSLAALAPLILSLLRSSAARGGRDSALALHRAQLAELDRELAEGRIGAAEHASAKLEVQRRLLAAAEVEDAAPVRARRFPLIATLTLVPALALGLYLIEGVPDMPAAPHTEVVAAEAARAAQEEALIGQLRSRLALLDPRNEQARQGYVLLGNAEAARGNMRAAAAAWRTALQAKYDPTLAAQTAEALTEAAGRVTEEAAGLFRGALDAAPKDAAWRPMAERRLSQVR